MKFQNKENIDPLRMFWFGADIHEIESSTPEQIYSSTLTDDSGECSSSYSSNTTITSEELITDSRNVNMPIANPQSVVRDEIHPHNSSIAIESDDMLDLQNSILSTIFEDSGENNNI